MASIVVDTVFLGLWLDLLHLFDLATVALKESSDLEWLVAKGILGVSTLALITLYILWDLTVAITLARKEYTELRSRTAATEDQVDPDAK